MENYKNIGEALNRYPLLTRLIQGGDGKTYALPRVSECLHCLYRSGRTAYYMPFVRDNNLKMFETYDEFVDYLRWVRDNDANGNSDKNDEIPMMWASGQTTNAITFFARNYMPYIDGGIALVNGKVTEQYKLNEFRETLRFMANMYKEKLIAPDSFTMTNEEASALANRETPIVGAFGHLQMNAIMTTNSPRWVQSFIMPTLKGKNGVMYASNFAPWQSLSNYMVLTDNCKNPEIAIGLYDYLMEFETELNSGFGPRGDFWDWPDEGALGLNGLPARYKMLRSSGEIPANLVWSDSGAWGAFYNEYRYGLQGVDVEDILKWLNTAEPSLLDKMVASASYNEAHNYLASRQAEAYKMPDDLFIPPIGYSDVDDTRLADINVGLNSYLSQSWVEFITGVRNIDRDADWNTYLREIDQLGGAEKTAIIQKYLN
jgi:putative aldouronate transport system substrate-binding protein